MVFKNIYDILKKDFEQKNGKVAIKTSENYTYNRLIDDIEKFKEYLTGQGVQAGDKIGLCLPNGYFYVVAFFAVVSLYGVVVAINWTNYQSNIDHIVDKAEIKYIITLKTCNYEFSKYTIVSEWSTYNAVMWISSQNKKYSPLKSISMCSPCLIIFTSGSTGKSKGIILTHQNLILGTMIVCDYLQIVSGDVILALLPFSFDYGLNQMLSCFLSSATLVIKYPYFIKEIPKYIEKEHITGLAGVPAIWINILNNKNIDKYSFSHLRYITNSGGSIPQKYLCQMKRVFNNTDIFLMYGLTECFRCTYLAPEYFETKLGSIGKAIPGCEVFIINNNRNAQCAPFEIGELVFRGPTIACGYINDIEATRNTFSINPLNSEYPEIVVFSGDLCFQDDDGFLFFVGRKDAQLKRYGYRINTYEIETALQNELNFINECCVVTIGEEDSFKLVAFCATQTDDPITFKEKIKNISNNKFPLYMRLDDIIIMNEIPKLYNQKYDTNVLKTSYIKRMKQIEKDSTN